MAFAFCSSVSPDSPEWGEIRAEYGAAIPGCVLGFFFSAI
jgi:hypothetical protein